MNTELIANYIVDSIAFTSEKSKTNENFIGLADILIGKFRINLECSIDNQVFNCMVLSFDRMNSLSEIELTIYEKIFDEDYKDMYHPYVTNTNIFPEKFKLESKNLKNGKLFKVLAKNGQDKKYLIDLVSYLLKIKDIKVLQ